MSGKPFEKGPDARRTGAFVPNDPRINRGGRMRGFERVAAEEADAWAKQRGITGEHAGLRAALRVAFERIDNSDTEDKDRLGYLRFAVERFAGKPREIIDLDTEPKLTDEEYREELRHVAREYVESMPLEERAKLLADPVPSPTIQ